MGDININGNHNSVVIGERKGIGFFGFFCLIIVLAWLIKHILVVLAIVGIAGFLCFIGWLVVWDQRVREEQAAEKRAIAARAQDQHNAYLRGDTQFGMHGEYPPAV